MSDYATSKFHPMTGKTQHCVVYEDYYGKGLPGFRFGHERVIYSQQEIEALQPNRSYSD